MTSKIIDWLKPKSATLAELKEQREHAITAHQATQAATTAAQDAFDADGSPSAEKALHGARDAERSALEHLGRSERLLAAAEAAEKEQRRQANEKKAAELERAINDRSKAKELEAATAQAAVALIDALLAERENNIARGKLQDELDGLMSALGKPERLRGSHEFNVDPSLHVVASDLDALADRIATDDPRRAWLRRLASLLSPGHHRLPRAAE